MSFVDVVKKYQACDPATGRFEVVRNNEQYARLLGVHPSHLTRLYRGSQPRSYVVARGIARVFPQAAQELMATLLASTPDDGRVTQGVA